jgi:hypothetical protein
MKIPVIASEVRSNNYFGLYVKCPSFLTRSKPSLGHVQPMCAVRNLDLHEVSCNSSQVTG